MSSVLILTLISLSLLYDDPANPADGRLILAGLNALYAVASITTVSAFVGYVMAYLSFPNLRIRYLADSAQWGYLVHLPIAAFLQVLIAPFDWVWPIKVLLILSVTGGLVWLTYHYGVRDTWVGMLLNGKRYLRPAQLLT